MGGPGFLCINVKDFAEVSKVNYVHFKLMVAVCECKTSSQACTLHTSRTLLLDLKMGADVEISLNRLRKLKMYLLPVSMSPS